MYSKKLQPKASKGSVQIKVSHGRLQLVFSYGGKRKYLSLGLPDNKLNRKVAEAKAKLIESDIAMERFDLTLSRYKPQFAPETVILESTSIDSLKPDLAELWEKYMIFKKPQISQSTYAVDYRKYRNHITSLPTRNLENATTIRDYLVANLTPNAARRVLININACCNWALKSRLIEVNPFISMASELNIPKSEQEDTNIRSLDLLQKSEKNKV